MKNLENREGRTCYHHNFWGFLRIGLENENENVSLYL